MTISSENSRAGPYQGNGVTTVFPFEFRILDEAHLRVVEERSGTETNLILNVDYSVVGVGNPGGSIAFNIPPATGQQITILRDVPFVQETDLENQGAFYAETVEEAFDFLTMQTQQLRERLNRTPALPVSSLIEIEQFTAIILRVSESIENIDTVAGIAEDVSFVAENIVAITAGIEDAKQARDEAIQAAADADTFRQAAAASAESSAAFATEARFYAEGVAAIIYDFGTFDDETSPEEDDWGVME